MRVSIECRGAVHPTRCQRAHTDGVHPRAVGTGCITSERRHAVRSPLDTATARRLGRRSGDARSRRRRWSASRSERRPRAASRGRRRSSASARARQPSTGEPSSATRPTTCAGDARWPSPSAAARTGVRRAAGMAERADRARRPRRSAFLARVGGGDDGAHAAGAARGRCSRDQIPRPRLLRAQPAAFMRRVVSEPATSPCEQIRARGGRARARRGRRLLAGGGGVARTTAPPAGGRAGPPPIGRSAGRRRR